jgi:gliding motility-associated-like protein
MTQKYDRFISRNFGKKRAIHCVCVLLFWVGGLTAAWGSHIRAGEVTARRISTQEYTYEITFTGYFDIETGEFSANAQGVVPLLITGGTILIMPRQQPIIQLGNGVTKNIYTVIHTFAREGVYDLRVTIEARNAGVLNIGPPPSAQLTFSVRSQITVRNSLGYNNLPQLLNPPVELAAVGQRYIHNPAAYDLEGDSLAYALVTPEQYVEGVLSGGPRPLEYTSPERIGANARLEDGSGPAVFFVDPLTGDLVWDAPLLPGLYSVALMIEEWRAGVRIGLVVRDIQIIVLDTPFRRPSVSEVPTVCVAAGEKVSFSVMANPSSGTGVTLLSRSGLYDAELVHSPLAMFELTASPTSGTQTGLFEWNTRCEHIRQSPYLVHFTATSARADPTGRFRPLTDTQTAQITVYAPAVEDLQVVEVRNDPGASVVLRWGSYQCNIPGAEFSLYRATGCVALQETPCQPLDLKAAGYTLLASLSLSDTTFTDTQLSRLPQGSQLSYRLVVRFPRPGSDPNDANRFAGGTTSLSSPDVCVTWPFELILPPCTLAAALDPLRCTPQTTTTKPCDNVFLNTVRWSANEVAGSCQAIYTGFRVYFAATAASTPGLIAELDGSVRSFEHTIRTSPKGCYRVSGLDAQGQETPLSEAVCQSACLDLALPNVFTPNGDGFNDLWRPSSCPSEIRQLHTIIYNRWGHKVFETDDVEINWNGRNQQNNELPAGTYYYQVKVEFDTPDLAASSQTLKGWVLVSR